MLMCHDVHVDDSVDAKYRRVEQKEHKRFYITITNTVVGPRAMMIHFVNTPSTLAAMMNSFNLNTSAFLALVRVQILVLCV